VGVLDCVEIWWRSLQGLFASTGAIVRFDHSNSGRPNPSCVLNLRREGIEVDIVFWESGEAEFSRMESDGSVSQQHFDDLRDTKKLAAVLSGIISVLLSHE
jgi:hypothetical protein